MTNSAVICSLCDDGFLTRSLNRQFDADFSGCLLIANHGPVTRTLPQMPRMMDAAMLDGADLSDNTLFEKLGDIMGGHDRPRVLIVDMDWIICEPWGGGTIEAWAELIEKLSAAFAVHVVSLYNQEFLVEEDLASVLRSHRHFLAPSGRYDNPFWLPPELAQRASTDAQLRFLLERIVPDYADAPTLNSPLESAASGTAPDWMPRTDHIATAPALHKRWHIHCLGELRCL